MTKLRILIVSSHLMFGYGLESLLAQEVKFDVVGQETDIERAIERIQEHQPDVIILDSDDPLPRVTPILRASPGVKVISLSLQSNDLYVYRAKQSITESVEDLIEAIKEDLTSSKSIKPKDIPGEARSGLPAQTS